MRRLDLTLPTPEENLALDEALLDWAEDENAGWEFLRIWESPRPFVVVGRSSRLHQEVYEGACRASGIPIRRRASGGAAIVAGPGCLMYALVLSQRLRPELKDIRRAHAHVLGRLVESLRANGTAAAHAGTSDLVISDPQSAGTGHRAADLDRPPEGSTRKPEIRKFAGNSLRAKRSHLLYHGAILYNFELSLIERCLRMPPRQPKYRDARSHSDFVMNLPLTRRKLVEAIDDAWPAQGVLEDWPAARVAELVATRYRSDHWTYEFG